MGRGRGKGVDRYNGKMDKQKTVEDEERRKSRSARGGRVDSWKKGGRSTLTVKALLSSRLKLKKDHLYPLLSLD